MITCLGKSTKDIINASSQKTFTFWLAEKWQALCQNCPSSPFSFRIVICRQTSHYTPSHKYLLTRWLWLIITHLLWLHYYKSLYIFEFKIKKSKIFLFLRKSMKIKLKQIVVILCPAQTIKKRFEIYIELAIFVNPHHKAIVKIKCNNKNI